jgi:uncharacterized protein YndB with AHSA1/START domain
MRQPQTPDTIIEEITIEARAERVFAALTSPEERVKWWGREGRFKATHMESDLRPEGKWIMRGIGVGGSQFTVQGVYREIQQPRLLSFTWLPSWRDDAGETLVRFDLEEKDGVTTVRVTHSGLTTEKSRTAHGGWPDILGWLRAYIERSETPSENA